MAGFRLNGFLITPSYLSFLVSSLLLLNTYPCKSPSLPRTRLTKHLSMWGKPDSVERRLQRWLSNERLDMGVCLAAWVRWVWQEYGEGRQGVLGDETKLSGHLGVMMLGLAYQGRCIPLLWRCYVANSKADYPVEGQVGIIMDLLNQLKAALPSDAKILVQADRGIGNSNHLMR